MADWIDDTPKYRKIPIPEFSGNPLLEALVPPPRDDDEAIKRLIQKPLFSPEERDLPSSWRRFLPIRLLRFFFPLGHHVEIMKQLYIQFFNGFLERNPFKPQGQRILHDARNLQFSPDPIIDTTDHRPATVSVLAGLSGTGKSVLMRAIMGSMGKPVIKHKKYRGKNLAETQILYLMRNVPERYTAKMFCKKYGEYADALLQENLYTKMFQQGSAKDEYVSALKNIVTNHHVGALVIDEIQRLSLAGPGGKKEVIGTIINLSDELNLPIVLVGTYGAADLLRSDASLAQRLTEGGFYELNRFPSASDEAWRTLCEVSWDYQWIKNPVPFSDEIVETLYDCSQGIIRIMLLVFAFAQQKAIDTGKEEVDPKMLKNVYKTQFKPLHGIINALCSKNEKWIRQYENLSDEAFVELKKNPEINRTIAIQEQVSKLIDAAMGVLDENRNVTMENKGEVLKEVVKLLKNGKLNFSDGQDPFAD